MKCYFFRINENGDEVKCSTSVSKDMLEIQSMEKDVDVTKSCGPQDKVIVSLKESENEIEISKEEKCENDALKCLLSLQKGKLSNVRRKDRYSKRNTDSETESCDADEYLYDMMDSSFESVQHYERVPDQNYSTVDNAENRLESHVILPKASYTLEEKMNVEVETDVFLCVKTAEEEKKKCGSVCQSDVRDMKNTLGSQVTECTEKNLKISSEEIVEKENVEHDIVNTNNTGRSTSVKRRKIRPKEENGPKVGPAYGRRSVTKEDNETVFCILEPKKRQYRRCSSVTPSKKVKRDENITCVDTSSGKRKLEHENVLKLGKKQREENESHSSDKINVEDSVEQSCSERSVKHVKTSQVESKNVPIRPEILPGSAIVNKKCSVGESLHDGDNSLEESVKQSCTEGCVKYVKSSQGKSKHVHVRSEIASGSGSVSTKCSVGESLHNGDNSFDGSVEQSCSKDSPKQKISYESASLTHKCAVGASFPDGGECSSSKSKDQLESKVRRTLFSRTNESFHALSIKEPGQEYSASNYYQPLLAKLNTSMNRRTRVGRLQGQVDRNSVDDPVRQNTQYMCGHMLENENEIDSEPQMDMNEEVNHIGWGQFSLYVSYICMFIVMLCMLYYIFSQYTIPDMSVFMDTILVFLDNIGYKTGE